MKYWLMKSEPDVFSIDHLKKDKTTWWTGVRNYAARNHMLAMEIGDQVLFYHSNAKPSGLVGIAEVSRLAAPDQLQFDPQSEYYDAKSTKDKPIWQCVEIKYKSSYLRMISLEEIKNDPQCQDMVLLKQGRLSVQPVTAREFKYLCQKGMKKINE